MSNLNQFKQWGGGGALNCASSEPLTKGPESIASALEAQGGLIAELVGAINECYDRMADYLGPDNAACGTPDAPQPAATRILDRVQAHNHVLYGAIAAVRTLRSRFQA